MGKYWAMGWSLACLGMHVRIPACVLSMRDFILDNNNQPHTVPKLKLETPPNCCLPLLFIIPFNSPTFTCTLKRCSSKAFRINKDGVTSGTLAVGGFCSEWLHEPRECVTSCLQSPAHCMTHEL